MTFFSRELGWRDVVNQSALKNCSIHQEEITTIFVNSSQTKIRRLACMDCISSQPFGKNISIKQAIENKDGERLANWPPVDDGLMTEVEQQLQMLSKSKYEQNVNDFWDRFKSEVGQKIEVAKQKTLRQVEQIQLCGDMMHQQYIQLISTAPLFEKIEHNRTSLDKMDKEIDKYIDSTYALADSNNEQLKKLLHQYKDSSTSFSLVEGIELEKSISNALENISFLISNNSRYKQQPLDIDQRISKVESVPYQQMSPTYSNQMSKSSNKKKSSSEIMRSSPKFSMKAQGQLVVDESFDIVNSKQFEEGEIQQLQKQQLQGYTQVIQISTAQLQLSSSSERGMQIGYQFYSSTHLHTDKYYNIELTFKKKILSNTNAGFCLGIIADEHKDTILYMNSKLYFSYLKDINNSNSLIISGQGNSIFQHNKIGLTFNLQICLVENLLRILPNTSKDNIPSIKHTSPVKKQLTNNSVKLKYPPQDNTSITNTCKIERNVKYRFCLFTNQPDQIIQITPYIFTH